MCFNKEVSLATYIVGMVGSAVLIHMGLVPEGLFFMAVVQMQLVEFMLWSNQPCNSTNKQWSHIGFLINHAEPIVLWAAIVAFGPYLLPRWVHAWLVLYTIMSAVYIAYVIHRIECTQVTTESDPHLHWKWNSQASGALVYMVFLLALVMLCVYGLQDGVFKAVVSVSSFLLSLAIYGNKKSTGAMWCFFASFAPWLFIARHVVSRY